MSTTSTPTPPDALVARDAHWSAKMDRLRKRQPMSVDVTFSDDDAAEQVTTAFSNLRSARNAARARLWNGVPIAERPDLTDDEIAGEPEVVDAQADLDQAEAAQRDADVVITLRGVPSDVFEDLRDTHQPTQEQAELGQTYNVNRFAPVLIAASCVDDMTPRQAAELIGEEWYDTDTETWRKESAILTQGEAAYLFQSAVNVNTRARVSLGKGSTSTPA